jgi:ankyrin repeat protein
VERLLARGANLESVNSHGQTPLSCAAQAGQIAMVQLLLEKGASLEPGHPCQSPLSAAARSDEEPMVRFLIQKGARPESTDTTGTLPLSWAALNGNLEVVRLLLEQSTEYGYRKTPVFQGQGLRSEWPPLSGAAGHGHVAIMKLLLEKNTQPPTAFGPAPLLMVAHGGYIDCMKLLLAVPGIDVNIRDDQNRTLLLIAAMKRHKDLVRLLLSTEGVDVNALDKHGWTALTWAAKHEDEVMMKELLEHGAEQFPYQELWTEWPHSLMMDPQLPNYQ